MLSLDIQTEKLEGTDKSEDAEVLDSTSTGRYLYFICPVFFLAPCGKIFMHIKNISCGQCNSC